MFTFVLECLQIWLSEGGLYTNMGADLLRQEYMYTLKDIVIVIVLFLLLS